MNPFDPSFEDLPGVLPIFPLTGALLLPRGQLPLNIFEPRYLEMIRDALAPPRMIGMIQPTQAQAEADEPDPALYSAGCAGRITQFEETGDGRFVLTLHGVCRFDVVKELEQDSSYRRCAVSWSRYVHDMVDHAGGGFDRKRLWSPLRRYFARREINANWDAIEKLDDDRLITTIAMTCPFAASEKQALLEAPNQTQRAELLITILEMASLGDDDDDTTRQ